MHSLLKGSNLLIKTDCIYAIDHEIGFAKVWDFILGQCLVNLSEKNNKNIKVEASWMHSLLKAVIILDWHQIQTTHNKVVLQTMLIGFKCLGFEVKCTF